MKTWIAALVAAALGIGVGVGITVAEFSPAREVFEVSEFASGPDAGGSGSASNLGSPKAVVEGSRIYNFGSIERDVKGRHTFVLRNEGSAALTIKVGQPTCKCTIATSPKDNLPPGESTEIEMEWKAEGYQPDFRQSVELTTNDPDNPVIRLEIHGNIVHAVRPIPDEITLGSISATDGGEADGKIFGYANEPLEIKGHSLVEAEIQAQPEAKSGYRIHLGVKSGLPVGPLNQTIRLQTNVPTAEVVDIPIRLTVSSDISIIGASPGITFFADKNVLRLGKLQSAKGTKVRMFVLVKGPHREETQLQVASVDPAEALSASIGEAEKLRDGLVLKYPLEITVPPNAAPISRMGGEQGELGRITIHTTHPIAKEVRLLVQFAVE
jgi:hypothetical protein